MTETKKAAAEKKTAEVPKKTAKPKGRPLGFTSEKMVKAEVIKDFPGHKKGEVLKVPERKLRDSAREVKRGLIKPK